MKRDEYGRAVLSTNAQKTLERVVAIPKDWDGWIPHGPGDFAAIRKLEDADLVEFVDFGGCEDCAQHSGKDAQLYKAAPLFWVCRSCGACEPVDPEADGQGYGTREKCISCPGGFQIPGMAQVMTRFEAESVKASREHEKRTKEVANEVYAKIVEALKTVTYGEIPTTTRYERSERFQSTLDAIIIEVRIPGPRVGP